ncbi:MAG TPA: V-type ATP synthase subunit E family protein [Phycisphaerae bacterium]|nr:V-type ATP synthase subunit E family protein [Phycisphaerae bacterium]
MTQTTNKLYDEVLSDARTKAERELRRGQKDAEAEARKIEDKARATVEEILGAARAEGDRLRRQVLATVEVEAQRQRLARLEEILRSVYEQAERRLGELSDQEQFDAQCRLTLEAVAQMPHDSLQVALPASSPAGRVDELIRRATAEADKTLDRNVALRPAGFPASVADGVVIRSEDGSVEVVQSLRERLRRMWPELRLDVARRLLPDEMNLTQTKEG